MAIPKFEADVEVISKLGDYPRVDDGLSPDGFKAKFDAAAILIKDYINNVLIQNLDELVDVQALLDGILDTTLSKSDKAAAAKATGDAVKKAASQRRMDVAKIFEYAIRSGDYVVNVGTPPASIISANKIRIPPCSFLVQGNLVELETSTDVSFDSAASGVYRNDLICGRVSRTEDGTETTSIVLIKGTELASAGEDPEYKSGNLNESGAVVHDVPLCRLKLHGSQVTAEKLYSPWTAVAARERTSAILTSSGWSDGYQTVSVSGVTADNDVFVSVPESSFEAYTDAGIRCVEQSEGKLKFKCDSAPTGNITVGLLIIS